MPTKKRKSEPESSRAEQIRSLLKQKTLTRDEFQVLCRLANVTADPELFRRADASGSIPAAAAKDFLQRGITHRTA